ncbi:amino acid adenylation domain-containing protein [Candidatus Omnitrophota bacterium]
MSFLLHQLLTESAATYPDNVALRFQGQVMSYAELDVQSNKLAHHLQALGAQPKDRVAICMTRGILPVIGIMGILKVGATYVPIDPMSPMGRLEYIVKKCAPTSLITTKQKLKEVKEEIINGSNLKTIILMDGDGSRTAYGQAKVIDWPTLSDIGLNENVDSDISDDDLAYILFTSGSTGTPKGVMISHRNSLTFIDSVVDFFNIRESDRISNNSPLHFDLSVFDMFVAFKKGASVVIVSEIMTVFPAKLAEYIQENEITVWNSVPSLLILLANFTSLDKYDLSSLRLVLFAGEVFPIKYLRRLKNILSKVDFYNIYGQTEANSSTYYKVAALPDKDTDVLPIGKPFSGFEVFALDDKGKVVQSTSEKGELYVRSKSVAQGYWQEDEKTVQAFVKDPLMPEASDKVYKTGDLVTLDVAGNYIFLGRKDHMIKSRGYRIEIGEIETVLSSHPDIKTAVVIPIPDELIGNRISVLVVPSMAGKLTKDDIAKYCFKHLPKYMIPEIIELRDSLPTTSSGKADRKKLMESMYKY